MTIEELNIPSPKGLVLANNPVVVNVPAYDVAGIADRTRLSYELEVYVYNGETWELLTTMEADEEPVKSVGSETVYNGAFFDVSSVLRSVMEEAIRQAQTDSPVVNVETISELEGMTLRWYTVSKVYVDGMIEETTTNAEQWAYRGAIGETDWADYKDVFFTKYIGETGKLLNDVPGEVDLGAVVMLNWIQNYAREIAGIRYKVVATYAGGAEFEVLGDLYTGVQGMAVYCVPVNLKVEDATVLGLPVEGLQQLTMWLIDADDYRVSEVNTVLVNNAYRRNSRLLVFFNSLNVPVTVAINGSSTETVSYERVLTEQYRGPGYEAAIAEVKIDEATARRKWLLRMVWSDEAEVRCLMDIGLAKEVYLQERGLWLPLIPTFTDWLKAEDGEELRGIELGMQLGYKETAYSELPELTGVTSRPTGWRPLTQACGLDSRDRYNGYLEVIRLEQYYTDNGLAVQPARTKKNKPGDADYIPPVASAACAMTETPFLSDAQSKTGSYNKATCASGEVGGPATITVPINSWGSKVNLANANDKAKAELAALDTQAYANANGTCNTVGVYNPGTIPANSWWLRVNGFSNETGIAADENAYRPGNMWFQTEDLQPNRTGVSLWPRFDVAYPVLTSPRKYRFHAYGLAGKTVRFFRNGLLVGSTAVSGYNMVFDFPANPANGEKWWIDAV